MITNLDLNKSFINSNQISREFINFFNKPGPYYSSYPILSNWKENNNLSEIYKRKLIEFLNKKPGKPIGLYLHVPYCAKLCYYCSCRMHISNNRDVINQFVKDLITEINMLNDLFISNKISPNVKEIHLGGGTPSHLTTKELGEIINSLKNFVKIDGLDEFSMEIDPRTVNRSHFIEYANLGVDRISFGVQDFDDTVQKKINRVQPFELVESLLKHEIRKNFKGVNFDLLYGLPAQTLKTFEKTINLTKELGPERITLIRYAHIPEVRKHIKMIKEEDLPPTDHLPLMFLNSTQSLIEGNYSWVGIDHFAKQTDQLAIAKREGRVYRNFGGETPGYTKDIISIGPTSTSGFGNNYFQSTYDLNEYRKYVRNGEFPITRQYSLSQEDIIRRECNFSLQCNQFLDFDLISKKFDIKTEKYFKREIEELKNLEQKSMVLFKGNKVYVTLLGRYLVRHICKVFDTFFDDKKKYKIHGN